MDFNVVKFREAERLFDIAASKRVNFNNCTPIKEKKKITHGTRVSK